jgi:hypothetical protein
MFDRVFDENTSQSDVYEATTKNLLDSVLDGYNATVFAYGATGCGKTHTITYIFRQYVHYLVADGSQGNVTTARHNIFNHARAVRAYTGSS